MLGPFGDRDGINGVYGGDARFAVRHGHDGQRTLSITVGLAGGFQKKRQSLDDDPLIQNINKARWRRSPCRRHANARRRHASGSHAYAQRVDFQTEALALLVGRVHLGWQAAL
jgi:hypothetical protein